MQNTQSTIFTLMIFAIIACFLSKGRKKVTSLKFSKMKEQEVEIGPLVQFTYSVKAHP